MKEEQLQKYDEWLVEHLDELSTQYPGKVVAIHGDKVVIVGDIESEVYSKIRKRGLEPMPLVLRVPREDDLQSILCGRCSPEPAKSNARLRLSAKDHELPWRASQKPRLDFFLDKKF